VNNLRWKHPKIKWQGILTRLWTGKEEREKYQEKYNISYPLAVDYSNSLFHQFKVRDLPTLLLVKNGKILFRTTENQPLSTIESKISQHLM